MSDVPLVEELACVWIEVPGLDATAERLRSVLGLESRASGTLAPEAGLGGWAGRPWALLGPPGFPYGMVCLVEGEARPVTRALPRGWDSVELVVEDVDAAAGRLAGWPGVRPVAEPFTTDLSELGSNVHRSGVWRMPWGTHLILTTGLTEPQGRSFPSARRGTGPVFEVHLRTDDHDTARRLYGGSLGMPALMAADFTEGPLHRAWGIPGGTPVSMSLLKSGREGTGRGAIELQGHPAANLDPAGLPGGTGLVSYACADLDAAHAAVLAGGHRATDPAVPGTGPLAGRRSFVAYGSEGERVHLVAHREEGNTP
ncbi:hypothetical protein AB0K05_10310 [Nonomuraea sp. NPDC049486]|uniref:hypothetical protein n=1 Tax=unclassified Nonomuraea TaxID=2593643 RepID=UPI0034395E99